MAMRALRLSAFGLFAAASAAADTYTVTSTADSGGGTLRQAISDANGHAGADSIAFAIAGAGPHTIGLASALPPITGAVTIDGYTQAGSSANTLPTGQGLNAILRVVVDGSGAGLLGTLGCMTSAAANVTIRGLVLTRCRGAQIRLEAAVSGNVVAGNFVGTTADGSAAGAGEPSPYGVLQVFQSNVRIGGTSPADRNLIAGNATDVSIGTTGASGSGIVVEGNVIGLNAAGTFNLPTNNLAGVGIDVQGGANVRIGGPTAASRNAIGLLAPGVLVSAAITGGVSNLVVEGNTIGTDVTGVRSVRPAAQGFTSGIYLGYSPTPEMTAKGNVIGGFLTGIDVQQSEGAVVQGNFIGTDATETADIGNLARGIRCGNSTGVVIGGTGPGEGNAIAFNHGTGVEVDHGQVSVRGNRMWDNKPTVVGTDGLAIDLMPTLSAGVTLNDAGDPDTGPNDLQNFPILTSAAPQAGSTRVQGTLNGPPSTEFDLDFYATTCARPRELPEGKVYLGSAPLTTNGSGNATFDELLPFPFAAGEVVSATATDQDGNTSELWPGIVHATNTPSGPAAGGTTIQLKGMLFQAGATVTVGGAAATNVSVVDAQTITAKTPPRPAGSLNDVVVTNPGAGGLSGTLLSGWIADFNDVPPFYTYHDRIVSLVGNRITLGCGGGNYCPGNSITRAEMAIFLIRAKYGACFTPPPATGTVFSDVAANDFGARHIELLASLGVTSGCGGGMYCPAATVTRDAMAVFLLRTRLGSGFVPPAATGMFGDVPVSHPFAKWIEELARRNITGGCGGNNYCPGNPNTRGEMAAFIARTFGLP